MENMIKMQELIQKALVYADTINKLKKFRTNIQAPVADIYLYEYKVPEGIADAIVFMMIVEYERLLAVVEKEITSLAEYLLEDLKGVY